MSKKLMKRVLAMTLALVMVVAGVISTPTYVEAAAAKPTSITLNTKSRTMFVGQNFTLKVNSVKPRGASTAVRFSSSKGKIASVNSRTGEIKALKAGKTTVTATSTANNKVKANCSITVRQRVTKISMNKSAITLKVGSKFTLRATVSPRDASNKKIKWTTSSSKTASVSSKGVVTARKSGRATITAAATDGSRIKATCIVGVFTKKVTSAAISDKTKTLKVGQNFTVKAKSVTPKGASDVYTWKSGTTSVATVDAASGKVTARKAGKAVITGRPLDGSKASKAVVKCTVTVLQPVKSITISGASTVEVNKSVTLSANVSPSDTSNKVVNWSTNASNIASISSSSGVVTGKSAGTATITATATDGSGKSATRMITVVLPPVSKVTLNKDKLSLEEGSSEKLTAKIEPSNARVTAVTWASSDSSIAKVDRITGDVTAVKASGKPVSITATADGKIATCLVTVTPKTIPITATGVKFEDNTPTSIPENEQTLKLGSYVSVTPKGASGYTLTWDSLNKSIATVDSQGVVTKVSAGRAVIEVTIAGTSYKDTHEITVEGKVDAVSKAGNVYTYTLYKDASQYEVIDKNVNPASGRTLETRDLNNYVEILQEEIFTYYTNNTIEGNIKSDTIIMDKWEAGADTLKEMLGKTGMSQLLEIIGIDEFAISDVNVNEVGDKSIAEATLTATTTLQNNRTYKLTLKETNDAGEYDLVVEQSLGNNETKSIEISNLSLKAGSEESIGCFITTMTVMGDSNFATTLKIYAASDSSFVKVVDVSPGADFETVIRAEVADKEYRVVVNYYIWSKVANAFNISKDYKKVDVNNVYNAPIELPVEQ